MGRRSIRVNADPWPSDVEIKYPPFQPYIFVLTTDMKPSSIAMAAVTAANMKYLNLPQSAGLDYLPKVQEIVRAHVKQVGVPLFDRITGYLFVFAESEGVLLNLDGSEAGHKTGRFWPQTISIQKQVLA